MSKTHQNYHPHRIEIDNTATLLNWAKTVQFDVSAWARPRCDYQDDYAHTAREVIDAAFNAATPDERRAILCAVYNTMSYDEVERLLLVRAKEVRRIELTTAYDDFDRVTAARENEITRKEQAIKDSMKGYHKRMAELRRQLADAGASLVNLRKESDRLRAELKTAKLQAIDDEMDAEKFRQVRALLGVSA